MDKILIMGVNGKVGQKIVNSCVNNKKEVRTMVRNSEQVYIMKSLDAEVFVADLEENMG